MKTKMNQSENISLQDQLSSTFSETTNNLDTFKIHVQKENWVEVATQLKDEHGLVFFSWLSAVDWENEVSFGDPPKEEVEPSFEILYCLSDITDGNFVVVSTKIEKDNPKKKIINLDGDDLRNINKNKDYSKEGRIKNISTAISIVRFLANKDYICIVSIVAPYRFLRDELKNEFPFLEVYLYTTEIRGREDFFAKDYEIPLGDHLAIDTGKLNIEESRDEILNVYRKMATLA